MDKERYVSIHVVRLRCGNSMAVATAKIKHIEIQRLSVAPLQNFLPLHGEVRKNSGMPPHAAAAPQDWNQAVIFSAFLIFAVTAAASAPLPPR